MKMPDVAELNKTFSLQDKDCYLRFKTGAGDIPVVEIQNEQAGATISLQGAHLLSWIPSGQDDVIWVSQQVTFAAGKSVRGGIPVCWPWFGAHQREASFPAHGFARTSYWQVKGTKQLSASETQITFLLDTRQLDKEVQRMWATPTIAEYRMTIAKELTLELRTENAGDQPITIGQALHTYFLVDDVASTTVTGLDGKEYLDKPENFKRKIQAGPITINSEVDRVYLNTPDDVIIDDQKRKIIVKKQGSQSTVVWNPWRDVAEKMGDLGKDGYRKMLCVESANAAEDTVEIQAGESHQLTVMYMLE